MRFDPELIQLLQSARTITVLSGAGISKESGIPTFREAQTGLWENYEATELATPQAFRRNPKLVWEWYQWRRSLVTQAEPNPAHRALVLMEQKSPSFHLITQNVDGLHQRAGSTNLIELHGNILRTKCFENNHHIKKWQEDGQIPPRCPTCGGRLRPDVVWFGENLPATAIERAVAAAQHSEIFLSIGTSGLVNPAASLPYLAKEAGALLVEVNPDHTPLSNYTDYLLNGPAGEILPRLVAKVWPSKGANS